MTIFICKWININTLIIVFFPTQKFWRHVKSFPFSEAIENFFVFFQHRYNPKSLIYEQKLSSIRMFSGFKSRWMMICSWRYFIAFEIPSNMLYFLAGFNSPDKRDSLSLDKVSFNELLLIYSVMIDSSSLFRSKKYYH